MHWVFLSFDYCFMMLMKTLQLEKNVCVIILLYNPVHMIQMDWWILFNFLGIYIYLCIWLPGYQSACGTDDSARGVINVVPGENPEKTQLSKWTTTIPFHIQMKCSTLSWDISVKWGYLLMTDVFAWSKRNISFIYVAMSFKYISFM